MGVLFEGTMAMVTSGLAYKKYIILEALYRFRQRNGLG